VVVLPPQPRRANFWLRTGRRKLRARTLGFVDAGMYVAFEATRVGPACALKSLLCLVGFAAACSSSTTVETQRDAGLGAQGGSGANPGGASGNAGTGTSGGAGTAGSNGAAGVSGSGGTSGAAGVGASSGTSGTAGSAGASGTVGTGGTSAAGSGGGGNADGSVGSGGACSPTNVTVDFTAQGNVRRDKFDQSGVSIVGSSDLQFSDESSTTSLDAGLGVYGGLYNWSIDNEEFVIVTFTPAAATNVKYFVDGALDVDKDGVFGKTSLSAISATGQALGPLNITDPGLKNVSALFGNVPLSKITIAAVGADGIVLGNLSFSECL
jgi:hypothetical protein